MLDNPLAHYFRTLDAGDLDACLAGFAEDATYSRPGDPETIERTLVTIRGKSAIREYLEEMRRLAAAAAMPPGWGPHELVACLREGQQSFAHGVVPSGPAGGVSVFLAHAECDAGGLIVRYVALAMRDPEAG